MIVCKGKEGYKLNGFHIMTFRAKLKDRQAMEMVLQRSPHVAIFDQGLSTGEYLFSCTVKSKTQQDMVDLVDEINQACKE